VYEGEIQGRAMSCDVAETSTIVGRHAARQCDSTAWHVGKSGRQRPYWL